MHQKKYKYFRYCWQQTNRSVARNFVRLGLGSPFLQKVTATVNFKTARNVPFEKGRLNKKAITWQMFFTFFE